MVVKSTQSRGGVKGQLPLAGCRDSVPCGAWGNAPTVGRLTYSKGKVNHGTLVAGSEASLRTNSRSRRSGIPHPRKKSTMVVCAAKGSRRRPQTSSVSIAPFSPPQRRNPLQHKNQLAQTHKAANIIAFCPQGGFSPCKKSPACRTTDGGN